jgi:hypothetical protein
MVTLILQRLESKLGQDYTQPQFCGYAWVGQIVAGNIRFRIHQARGFCRLHKQGQLRSGCM